MTNEKLVELVQKGENVSENMGLLFKQNKSLIYKFVHNKVSYINDLDDLMQQAYIGVYNAALAYNQEKMQCLFSTMMKFHIFNSLRDNSELPEHMKILIFKYNYFENGIAPSDDYICGTLNIDKRKLNTIKICSKPSISLDITLNDDEDISLHENIADEKIESFNISVENDNLKHILNNALSKLSEQERYIIMQAVGYNRNYNAIGEDLGLTYSEVRKVIDKGLRSLRKDIELRKEAQSYIPSMARIA